MQVSAFARQQKRDDFGRILAKNRIRLAVRADREIGGETRPLLLAPNAANGCARLGFNDCILAFRCSAFSEKRIGLKNVMGCFASRCFKLPLVVWMLTKRKGLVSFLSDSRARCVDRQVGGIPFPVFEQKCVQVLRWLQSLLRTAVVVRSLGFRYAPIGEKGCSRQIWLAQLTSRRTEPCFGFSSVFLGKDSSPEFSCSKYRAYRQCGPTHFVNHLARNDSHS